MIPTASVLQGHEKCGDFAETTAFERCGVKTSEKANTHNQHWLTSTRFSPFYVSKSSAALNPLTITQLACERYSRFQFRLNIALLRALLRAYN